jgi:hypothetical protein
MKQCLRCGIFCREASIFCQSCQSSLLKRFEQEPYQAKPVLCPETKVLPATKMIQDGDSVESGPLAARQLPWVRRAVLRRMRRSLIALVLFIVLVLIVDGILALLMLTHSSPIRQRADTFPLLTLTPSISYLGQTVQVHLSHFPPSAPVLLTRDVAGSLRLDVPAPLIRVDAAGNATVRVLIEGKWGVGTHILAAEDTSTHYVASGTLQVIGSGPVLPPQLQRSQSFLDMGLDWPGTNTLRSLKLSNSGGESISWLAKSNQPWLQLTPAQGVFSDNQTIAVVATRVHMKAGNYQGMLTVASNTGVSTFIQVKMSVRTAPTSSAPMLTLGPPVLAFAAIDGESEPPDQSVTISNPGIAPLAWSATYSAPTETVNQSIPFEAKNWLQVFPASGVLAPRTSMTLHIQVQSDVLFPGLYSGVLSISGMNALDTPQTVAISLSVQQQCGVVTDVGMMTFIATAGQQAAESQNVGLHTPSACSGVIPWSAFTLTDWLAVTPANGQVPGQSGGTAVVSMEGKLQQPGIFTSLVIFLTEHHTQTISVQLTVLPAASGAKSPDQSALSNGLPGKTSSTGKAGGTSVAIQGASRTASAAPPLLGVSPVQLAFTVSQGQASAGAHHLTLANSGGHALIWQATISGSASSWLMLAATQGTLGAKETTSLAVDTDAANLVPGTYTAQIIVSALDGSGVAVPGSPQAIPVTLNVVQPCVLQVTPTTLSFSASVLHSNPADQTINLNETGTCSLPVSWQANSGSNWLVVSPVSGSKNGTGSSVNVHVDTAGKLLGRYNGQIAFSAQDSTGVPVKINAPTISVTLNVLG